MQWVLMAVAAWIAWEDWRDREIHLHWILLFFAAATWLFFHSIQGNPWTELTLRLVLVAALLGSLFTYLALRHGLSKLKSTTYFALGDVLILFAALPVTGMTSLLICLLLSCLLGLLYGALSKTSSIPFAGIYAAVVALTTTFLQL